MLGWFFSKKNEFEKKNVKGKKKTEISKPSSSPKSPKTFVGLVQAKVLMGFTFFGPPGPANADKYSTTVLLGSFRSHDLQAPSVHPHTLSMHFRLAACMGCERMHQMPHFATTMDALLWIHRLFGYFVVGENRMHTIERLPL